MSLQFRPDTEAGKVLRTWWEGLEDNKGGRAELRRCYKTSEVLFVPAYHELFIKLRQHGSLSRECLPAVAGLLAHVKTFAAGKNLAQQMVSPKAGGSQPSLSEIRFRRLLQCQSQEELFPELRRALYLLDGAVNIYSLAKSVYYWKDEKTRQDWAYAYYGALQGQS